MDTRTDEVIAEWWDDEARQMFEDGFSKQAASTLDGELKGGGFVDSVLDYAGQYRLPHMAEQHRGRSGANRLPA